MLMSYWKLRRRRRERRRRKRNAIGRFVKYTLSTSPPLLFRLIFQKKESKKRRKAVSFAQTFPQHCPYTRRSLCRRKSVLFSHAPLSLCFSGVTHSVDIETRRRMFGRDSASRQGGGGGGGGGEGCRR